MLLAWLIAASFGSFRENRALAQTPEPAKTPAKTAAKNVDFAPELDAATAELKAKFEAGKTNAADMEESITAIKALITKHFKDGKREQLARLYLLDAHIYADGLHDAKQARAIWEQVLRDYPGTLAAKGAWISLGLNVPEGLEVGQRFPDFSVTDLAGSPLSVSGRGGRVTLVDFWATWCGPCKAEMPHVITAYQTYHGQGFNIIGVSLDSSRQALVNFTQAQGMTWPQYFDGLQWQNRLAVRYGINSIPMNYLLNRYGIIIGKDLRGSALSEAVVKALAAD